MKVLGLGTDIVEIDRIEKAMNKTEKFMEKVFSPVEIEYCQKKIMATIAVLISYV